MTCNITTFILACLAYHRPRFMFGSVYAKVAKLPLWVVLILMDFIDITGLPGLLLPLITMKPIPIG